MLLTNQQPLLTEDDPVGVQVDGLMNQMGYHVVFPASSPNPWKIDLCQKLIRNWILHNVRDAYEYQHPGMTPNSMLWFCAPRQSGKTTAIQSLVNQMPGSHIIVTKSRTLFNPSPGSQGRIIRDPLDIKGWSVDYIWVDEWCSYVKSANDFNSLFCLEPNARVVTLISTPGMIV